MKQYLPTSVVSKQPKASSRRQRKGVLLMVCFFVVVLIVLLIFLLGGIHTFGLNNQSRSVPQLDEEGTTPSPTTVAAQTPRPSGSLQRLFPTQDPSVETTKTPDQAMTEPSISPVKTSTSNPKVSTTTIEPTTSVPSSTPVTSNPSRSPIVPTLEPSLNTSSPTLSPSISSTTISPTASPTTLTPSLSPTTTSPTGSPTKVPTFKPTETGTAPPSMNTETVFYAIADVPYKPREAARLRDQFLSLPEDGEFLIHLGDIKAKEQACTVENFKAAADLFHLSPVPVFLVVGDNEFNDCSDPSSALLNWRAVFKDFDKRWSHSFNVTRPSHRPENFMFIWRQTLYIGLNIVGGLKHMPSEWDGRLIDNINWTISLLEKHTNGNSPDANGVVIFAHANPGRQHEKFFQPLVKHIGHVMENRVPILYMGGDVHSWLYEPKFYHQDNFLRIRLNGGSVDQPLKMSVNPTRTSAAVDAFQFEREYDEVPRRELSYRDCDKLTKACFG